MSNTIVAPRVREKVIYSAIFLLITTLLPQFCHLIGGSALASQVSPMHLPVYLCAYFAGPIGAMVVGLVAPILSSVLFGMPLFPAPMLPMCVELMTYGAVFGYLYSRLNASGLKRVALTVVSLLVAMIAGRLMLLCANLILVSGYDFAKLIHSTVVNQWIGLIIQMVSIPLCVLLADKLKK